MAMLAARQYGVVTGEQLHYLGYSADAVDRMVAVGRLHAWHRSVFAVGHHNLSAHGLCMAAVLFRGSSALISHQSAVWLWGLERKLEIPVHVSVRWRGHAQDAIGLHHCPALRDEDVAETERLPVTAVPRTLLDYAAEATQVRLERAIDKADRMELLDLAALDRITDEVSGHRGRGALLQALTVHREKGFTRSGGEKRMLAALADAGVRRPLVNNFVEGHELDFFWEEERSRSNSTAGSTTEAGDPSSRTVSGRRNWRWRASRRSGSPAPGSNGSRGRWRCASPATSPAANRTLPRSEFAESRE